MKGAAGPRGLGDTEPLARGQVLLRHRQGGKLPVREPETCIPACVGTGNGTGTAPLGWAPLHPLHCNSPFPSTAALVWEHRHGKLGDVIQRRKIPSVLLELPVTWQQCRGRTCCSQRDRKPAPKACLKRPPWGYSQRRRDGTERPGVAHESRGTGRDHLRPLPVLLLRHPSSTARPKERVVHPANVPPPRAAFSCSLGAGARRVAVTEDK